MKKITKKTKLRVLHLALCSVMCLTSLFALFAVPIGAVINSSQGTYKDWNLTQRSTFPITFGYMYQAVPASTASNANSYTYVFNTQLGGYGQEWNMSQSGVDEVTYTWQDRSNGGQTLDKTARMTYEFIDALYLDEYDISYQDGPHAERYRRGYQEMHFECFNNADSTLQPNQQGAQVGITIKADDVVYNPYWLVEADDLTKQHNDPLKAMLPCYYLESFPDGLNFMMNRIVFKYDVRMTIIDQFGGSRNYTYSGAVDTDSGDTSAFDNWHSFVPMHVLKGYIGHTTIIIDDFVFTSTFDYYARANDGSWVKADPYNQNQQPLGRMSCIRYPLYDSSGVSNLGSSTYEEYYCKYGMTDVRKWIHTTDMSVGNEPTSIFDGNITKWIGKTVSGFLDFELFPGFSLSGVLGILLAFAIVCIFLKLFSGA